MVVLNDDDFQRLKTLVPADVLEEMVVYENVWVPFKLTKEELPETSKMPEIVWDMFLEFTAEYEDGEFCIKEILQQFYHELRKMVSTDKTIAQYLGQEIA